jgi:putative SOS response-associated peptidase YedK
MCYSVMVRQDLQVLERDFGARPVRTQFERYESMTLRDPKKFRPLANHRRIYPMYFAPVVTARQSAKWILPMRYRIRPAGSRDEVPTRYNVFNARLDSLTNRSTWRPLFGRNHGIIGISEFFEWVQDHSTHKKKVVGFSAKDVSTMYCPVLWDWWQSPESDESFFSFAIITGEPPAAVLAAGHDRCPVFLNAQDCDWWLSPEGTSQKVLLDRLHASTTYDWTVKDATP